MLRSVGRRIGSFAQLSTYARVAAEAGERNASVEALQVLLDKIQKGSSLSLAEPFWPAFPRFDTIVPKDRLMDWFVISAAEQFERTKSFSSLFGGATPVLAWLCRQPLASVEMERRRVLLAARAHPG